MTRLLDISRSPDDVIKCKNLLCSLEHHVQILRRELVRAIRQRQLEFNNTHSDYIERPSRKDLEGSKDGVASYVNRLCFGVTRALAFYPIPLLPLRVKETFQVPCPTDWRTLEVTRTLHGDWKVGSGSTVASSEATTLLMEGEEEEEEEEEKVSEVDALSSSGDQSQSMGEEEDSEEDSDEQSVVMDNEYEDDEIAEYGDSEEGASSSEAESHCIDVEEGGMSASGSSSKEEQEDIVEDEGSETMAE